MSNIGNYNKGYTESFNNNANKYWGIYEGIVKENSDFQRMGRLGVWVPELGSPEEDGDGWVNAMYLTPFGGATSMSKVAEDQTYDGTQRSYGFWAIPPDPDNRVAVQFLNGDPSRAVWVGCFYQQYRNTMVPNIPKHNNYQYGEQVPGAEPNISEGAPSGDGSERPYHREHYEAIRNQGLEEDPIRGYSQHGATSSPLSKVYGMLTPKGHYWSMEDTEKDEKIRIRTIGGAQILLDDANSVVYITNQAGNGWVEIDKDGKIMVYSDEGIACRSKKDISLVADRDLLFEAGRNTILKTKDQTFIETTDLFEDIEDKHDVDIGGKRSERIKEHDQNITQNQTIHVEGQCTVGVDKEYNLNVENNVDISTKSKFNLSVEEEMRIGSRGDASFSSMKKTNIISQKNIALSGKKVIENSGGNAEPPTPPQPAKPKVSDIPERPTYDYEDTNQKKQDNGTGRRQVASLASAYPTHEPSKQHSKPSYDRDENADDAGQSNQSGGGDSNSDNSPDSGGDSTPDSGSGDTGGNDTGGSDSGGGGDDAAPGGSVDIGKVKRDLKRHESYETEVYPDPLHGASVPTGGVGHVLLPNERSEFSIGDTVSHERIEQWLDDDVGKAINGCKKIYGSSWDGLSTNRKNILTNMCFNLGQGNLTGFKRMNAAVKRGDFDTASHEMRDSDWYHQVGGRAEEMAVRMKRNT